VVHNTLSHPDYIFALRQKLNEEVAEYEELADILEVVYALAEATGCSEDQLNALRQSKADARGKFKEKILLKTVG
jgi:predicted house-cleaning noncanonical NTP pyrophosphatase (MazG superfamily)